MKLLVIIATLLIATATQAATPFNRVEVMVIGSYHFANHNRDLHNVRSDDVLAPERQRELVVLAERLSRWRPTKIMVEVEPPAQGQRLTGPHGEFDRTMLSTVASERVQIGYRVAFLVQAPVFAINEQPDAGAPDYFPFGKVAEFAKAHSMEDRMAALQREAEEAVSAVSARLATQSIPAVLADLNTDQAVQAAHRPYLDMIQFGDLNDQPGAELYAYWMMRNAKIFGKAMQVVEPGDRVLIIYGSGHAYWLRHFAAQMPGYRLVSPSPLLAETTKSLGR